MRRPNSAGMSVERQFSELSNSECAEATEVGARCDGGGAPAGLSSSPRRNLAVIRDMLEYIMATICIYH